MSTYKCRLICKIVYTMYRDRIRDFTNTSTYPECRDTWCRVDCICNNLADGW